MKTSLRMGILGLSTVAIGLSFQLALDIAKPQFNVQREIASTSSLHDAQEIKSLKAPVSEKAKNFVEHNSKKTNDLNEKQAVDENFGFTPEKLHAGLDNHFKNLGLTIVGRKVKEEKKILPSDEVGKYSVLKVVEEQVTNEEEVVVVDENETTVVLEDSKIQDLQDSLCQKDNQLNKLSDELEETRQSLDDVLAKLDSRAPAIDAPNFQMEDITSMFGEMMKTIMAGFATQQAQAAQVVQMHNPLQDIVMQNLLYRSNAERSSIMPEANYRVNTYNNYYGNVQQFGGQQMNNQRSQKRMNSQMPQQQRMSPGYDWRTEQDILSQDPQVPQVPRDHINDQSHIQLS